MSFYLKYRPQNFSDVVGQTHITTTLQNALKLDMLSHAYLLSGSRGLGKTSIARILAKSLNCQNFNKKTLEPCQKCEMCLAIKDNKLIDVIEIDAASNRGIDEIRELRETIKFAPTQANNKIYIIDEVHMLTKEAFNALLKTLEEPPANVYFVLATTEIHKIPDTIISRCQRFDFRRISNQDLMDRLKFIAKEEEIKFEDEALELIANSVNGGMRDAITIFEQLSASGNINLKEASDLLGSVSQEILQKFLNSLLEKKSIQGLEIINQIQNDGVNISQFQKHLLMALREELLKSIQIKDLKLQTRLIKIIEDFQQISLDFKSCSIPQLALEILVAKQNQINVSEISKESAPVSQPDTVAKVSKNPNSKIKKSILKEDNFFQSKPKTKIAPLKIETKKEKKTNTENLSVSTPSNLNLEDLKKTWINIVSKIPKVSLKMAMQQTEIRSLVGNNIEIGIASTFYLDKLNSPETKQTLEIYLEKTLSEKVRVEFLKVESVKISKPTRVTPPVQKPIVQESPTVKSSNDSQNANIVEEALAMFADEIQFED